MKTIVGKSLARNLFPLFLNVAVLFFAVQQAAAIISTNLNLQMQLGNPTGATADPNNHLHYLIQRTVETIDYSDTNGCPNWASWDLTTADTSGASRTDAYATDTSLPSTFRTISNGTFGTVDGTSYDRGHMCPSADRLDTTADNKLVFLMSNMIVQDSKNNEGIWNTFEGYCRDQLTTQELLIICGPYDFTTNTAGSSKVYIASNIFKVAVCVPLGGNDTALGRITNANPSSIRVIAIETPNDDSVSGHSWTNYITSTKQVQQDTGYNFFSALPNNLAWVLRSKVDGQTPAAPGITSFSPSSGTVGASVTITGPRLDTVTNVFFNGTVASYTITATNQITATVPTGATSGSITAKGLGGTATSSSSFTVTTGGNPDLAITKSHTGDFTQGDIADTYTITVTNVGNAASSGTVTVTDAPPASLTATAISGTGWTATLSTLTCTRSDALAAGASYPPITVTVNVSASAPASVTNSATVSGGGDTIPDTASDPTTINALNPAQLSVSPSSGLTSSGTVGGPFSPSSQVYALGNTGSVTMNWTVSNTATWLTLSATSGALAGGDSTNVTVSINANANGLAAGSYSDTVSFTNATNGAGNTTRAISLTVLAPFQGWQNYYWAGGASNPNAAPDLDPYGKGISNTNQFLAGFNPTNTAAYPRIINIIVTTNNDVTVTYLGANGDNSYSGGPAFRTNVLEYTGGTADGSYMNNFASTGQTNVLSGGTGLGIITNMTDNSGATNVPSRYYRVRVLVP